MLLRDTLASTRKVGVARVVIRTREYLCAVIPEGDALVLMMLRYPQELVEPDEYKLPAGKASDYRITAKEREMAESLIGSMSAKWAPDDYHDEFRQRLEAIIKKRIKARGATTKIKDDDAPEREDAATNVVDFMALLQKSLDTKKRTPAKTPAKKAPAKKAPRKAAKAAKKAPAKKAARKAASR